MKKFIRHLSHEEVINACAKAGFAVDSSKYESEGSDWITIDGVLDGCPFNLIYSSWNGRFMGKLGDGTFFHSDSEDFDVKPWFVALLEFFYVGEIGGAPCK